MAIDQALLRSPANRVLLRCARASAWRESDFSRVSAVSDWPALLLRLRRHRLLLLLAHHLAGHEALLPPAIGTQLQDECETTLHHNLNLLLELQGLMAFLCERGLRVLAYKGPSLALCAYKSLALRTFVDLDLLVSPRERRQVVAALHEHGFDEVVIRTRLSPFLRRHRGQDDYEVPLCSRDGLTVLDVHWAVAAPFESFPLSFEELWKRRAPVPSLPGISTLSREDLLVALSFHGLKHGWKDLEWIACMGELLRSGRDQPLDWRYIAEVAGAHRCERIIGLAMRLALDLAEVGDEPLALQGTVPPLLWHSIAGDQAVEGLARRVWKEVLRPELKGNWNSPSSVFAHELRWGLRGRPGFHARWKLARGLTRTFALSLERSQLLLSLTSPWLR